MGEAQLTRRKFLARRGGRALDRHSFYGAQYAQVMALAILGALPLLIAFLLFQRQIVQGISNTGLKG